LDLFNGALKVYYQSSTNTTDTHIHTTPTGKKWIVFASSGNRDNAGNITIGINPIATRHALAICNFESYTAVTIYRNALFNPMTMCAGDQFQVFFDTGTSGALNSKLLVMEKDA